MTESIKVKTTASVEDNQKFLFIKFCKEKSVKIKVKNKKKIRKNYLFER